MLTLSASNSWFSEMTGLVTQEAITSALANILLVRLCIGVGVLSNFLLGG